MFIRRFFSLGLLLTSSLLSACSGGAGAGGQSSSSALLPQSLLASKSQTLLGAYPNGTPPSLPATIELSNYDLGGEGVAYNTESKTNLGGQYRDGGVSIQKSTVTGGNGLNIGWLQSGNWFDYTISVPTAGTYPVTIPVASDLQVNALAGLFHIQDANGNNLTGEILAPGTGGWQSWKTTGAICVRLKAGTQTLRLVIDKVNAPKSSFNLAYLDFGTPQSSCGAEI